MIRCAALLTVLITGKFNNDPITGIRRKKLIATGKKPLQDIICTY